MQFQLTESALALGLRLVAWCEHGLNNHNEAPELEALREHIFAKARSSDPERDAVIAGYDALRKRVGRSVRRFPPSPMALQGQFERRGELGTISPAVDIYNLVSLATGLSIGGHDLSTIQGDIRLGITQGHETFLPLGSDDERLVPAHEYAYLDASDRVLCRMEYRQSGHTCIGANSQDCVFIVQGHTATSMATLEQAADRVSSLLAGNCGSHRGETWRLG
jgi:DNA/RNA-binding domain of Phe-tRNA-synthetase-like protein